MKATILVTIICFLALSCEGSRLGEGFVYDAATNEPLDSVAVKRLDRDIIVYTDSVGHYIISGPFGGCLPDCPDFAVRFSKAGYQTKRVDNPDGNIFLETE